MARRKVEIADLNDVVGKVVRWKSRPFFSLLPKDYLEDSEGRTYAIYKQFVFKRGGVLTTTVGEFRRSDIRGWWFGTPTKATLSAITDESMLGDVEINRGSGDRHFRMGNEAFELRTIDKSILHPTLAIYDCSCELVRSKYGSGEIEIMGQHALLAIIAAVMTWVQWMDD